MKYAFITGIPTSGKSWLGKKLATELGIRYVSVDAIRDEVMNDPAFEEWVNFYWKQDEKAYYETTTPDQQWQDLVKQSEALWALIRGKIEEVVASGASAIFEGVNILPHLAARDLEFPGIVLLGASFEETFERNKKTPRWGATEDLQRLEADEFFNVQRPRYEQAAEQYGYKSFTDINEAEQALREMLT